MAEVALIQRGRGKYQHQDLEDDSDSDQSDAGVGKVPVQPCMKNGLLIRRRIKHSETIPGQPGDVELDDWITGTSPATNKGSQQSDLRLRKNNVSLNEVYSSFNAYFDGILTVTLFWTYIANTTYPAYAYFTYRLTKSDAHEH